LPKRLLEIVVSLVSSDMARTAGIDVDLLFLLAFALAVALGLRHLISLAAACLFPGLLIRRKR